MKMYAIWDQNEGFEYTGEITENVAKAMAKQYAAESTENEYSCFLFELVPVCRFVKETTVTEGKFNKLPQKE